MNNFISFLALATLSTLPSVLAAPSVTVSARGETQEVAIHVKIDKATSEKYVAISNKNLEVLAEACSGVLNAGAFADFPISTNLDNNGAGNITLGANTFRVHEDSKLSNDVLTCTRMYNDVQAFVNCKALIPANLRLAPLSKRDTCLKGKRSVESSEYDLENVSLGFTTASFNSTTPIPQIVERAEERPTIEERQRNCDRLVRETWRIGDGNPHQNWFHQQLSEQLFCGAAQSCTVGFNEGRGYTKGWEASASAWGWISAGFAVQTTIESGNSYECTAGSGETVCVWYNFAHTAYTVQNYQRSWCGGDEHWFEPFVMFSPNINNRGGGKYCVVGTCRGKSDNWWDKSPRQPGGP